MQHFEPLLANSVEGAATASLLQGRRANAQWWEAAQWRDREARNLYKSKLLTLKFWSRLYKGDEGIGKAPAWMGAGMKHTANHSIFTRTPNLTI
jgi:hypothetical protein